MKQRTQVGVFDIVEGTRRERAKRRREQRKVIRDTRSRVNVGENYDPDVGFPARAWGVGGNKRKRSGFGTKDVSMVGIKVAAHTAATAFPFVAGPNLGMNGAYVGDDLNGGGPFCLDPWEAYNAGAISGMSMLVFGTVGMGKSTLVKTWVMRLVLAGRRLAVASDLKGEWTRVVRALGGPVIQVGPGLGTRLNPLDEGIRPSVDQRGEPMTDEKWVEVVRNRRMSIMETLVKILTGQEELSPAEHSALGHATDAANEVAAAEARTPTLVDVLGGLKAEMDRESSVVSAAAEQLHLSLARVTSGALAGMFDGESTARFSATAPAVSIDTSAMRGAAPVARRMAAACCATWMEAMVTNPDGGNRLVIYEEGWDSVSSRADLERMVNNWKLSRDYGIFNILILHKVNDLNMAGDSGSQMAAMAKSLVADADIKVIYRQDRTALRATMDELDLNEREKSLLSTLRKGQGLWRVGEASFEVVNLRSAEEIALVDTDDRMDRRTRDVEDLADLDDVYIDENGAPVQHDEWWQVGA